MSAETRIVFVSGLSGSGRTTAMAALEDLGFYCVDNLPVQLTAQFLDLCAKATPPIRKVALAIDARETAFLQGLPGVVEELRATGAAVHFLFLDCANEVLVNRYRETRRVHPLSPEGSVSEGIERERRLLADVATLADQRIDTSELNVHRLRETVQRVVQEPAPRTVVNLLSFGYRWGVPAAADLLFDVRFLPNPHFEPALRPRTGRDPEVARHALGGARGKELRERLAGWLRFLLPLYDEEGKAYLTVGVGCTGGRHRSVAMVEALAEDLAGEEREINVTHRDVEKSG
jgi:UPF0042 nucleotide-binding protein